MRYSYIFILIVIIVIISVLVFNNKKELFNNYDYIYEGDLVIDKGNIGIGKEPESDKKLIVDGTLHVEDELCLGDTCFDYDTIKKLNELPVFKKDELCLKDDKNPSNNICINEDHLKLITGEKNIIFNNNYDGGLQPFHLSRHGGYNDDPSLEHDDETDGKRGGGLASYLPDFLTTDRKQIKEAIISSINPIEGTNIDFDGKLITVKDSNEYSIVPDPIKNEVVKWDSVAKDNKTIEWIYTKHENNDETGYIWISGTNGQFYQCKKECKSEEDFKELLKPPGASKIKTMAIFEYGSEITTTSATPDTDYYIYAITDTNKHYIINIDELYLIIKDIEPGPDDNKWKLVNTDKKFTKLTSIGSHLYGLSEDGTVFKISVSTKFKQSNKYTYWAKYSDSLTGSGGYLDNGRGGYGRPAPGSPWDEPDKYVKKSKFTFKKIIIHNNKVYVICDLLGYYPKVEAEGTPKLKHVTKYEVKSCGWRGCTGRYGIKNTTYTHTTYTHLYTLNINPKLHQENITLQNLMFEFDINDISGDISKLVLNDDPPWTGKVDKSYGEGGTGRSYSPSKYIHIHYNAPVINEEHFKFKWIKFPENIIPDGASLDITKKKPHKPILDLCIGSKFVYITDTDHHMYQQTITSFETNRFKDSLKLGDDSSMTLFSKKYLITTIVEHKGVLWLLTKNYELYKYSSINHESVLDLRELENFKKTDYKGTLIQQENQFTRIYIDFCNNLIGVDMYNNSHVYGDFNHCTVSQTVSSTEPGSTNWVSLENDQNMIVYTKNNVTYSIIDDKLMKKTNGKLEMIDTDVKYIVPLDYQTQDSGNYLWCIKKDDNLYQYSLSDQLEDIISWQQTTHENSTDISISIENDIWSTTKDSIYKNDKKISNGINKRILANGEDYIYRVDDTNELLKCKKPCNYGKWSEVEIEKANSDKFQSDKNSLYYLENNKIKYKNMLNVMDDFSYKCYQRHV